MTDCPKCGVRRGRRSCPALDATICSICCGAYRLREIACPEDCPHLASGERFQGDKRLRRGVQRGRGYLARRGSAFPDRDDFAFALAVEARAYRHLVREARAGDADVRRAFEAVAGALGPVVLPGERSELAVGLLRDIREHPEFAAFRCFTDERRRRILTRLMQFLPAGGSGSEGRAYLESIRAYFEEVLPEEGGRSRGPLEPRGAPGEHRSEGGIILP